jgi:hypothetical protein
LDFNAAALAGAVIGFPFRVLDDVVFDLVLREPVLLVIREVDEQPALIRFVGPGFGNQVEDKGEFVVAASAEG